MTFRNYLSTVLTNPAEFRDALSSKKVLEQLESIGIDIRVYELHAPAPEAKKKVGLGVTLCGRPRNMRNAHVTCKKCLAKIAKQQKEQELEVLKALWKSQLSTAQS